MKIRFEPFDVEIEVEAGTSVLEASLQAGVHINASCGGSGVCGKCAITVKEGQYKGGISEKVSAEDQAKGVRLACTTIPTGDLVVEVPVHAARDDAGLKLLATGSAKLAKLIGAEDLRQQGRYDPALAEVVVTADPPSGSDNTNDVGRLLKAMRAMGESNFAFRFEAVRDLPDAWREGNWTVTAKILRAATSTGKNQVIHVMPGDDSARNIVAAIDLGTTTVWAQFIDLATGEILGSEGDFNAQIGYGEDVITRIMYAKKDGGLKRLQEAAANSINEVLKKLSRSTGVDVNEVNLATIAGNTTMTQLFLGVNPQYIRLDPYVPAAAYYPPVQAYKFGLSFQDHVPLLIFPAVASYVGGDVISGVMGSGMHVDERLTLFIDMGTNGEVVVGNKDWMVCAAASAGPAFEGGGIKFGMRAAKGAIENFSVDPVTGEPSITTIGRSRARGICGSGLINAVSALLLTNLIDERGKFNVNHPSDRLRVGEDGPEYVLVWKEDGALDRDITITEPDMDNLIRAKGAMYAAYMTLLESVGLTIKDLDRVILAGGFGQSINLERAQIIGLLPEMPADQFIFVGNGSLLGARLICMSNQLRSEVLDIVDKMTNFELSVAPGYMDAYMAAQFLPHTEAKRLFPNAYEQIQLAHKAFAASHQASRAMADIILSAMACNKEDPVDLLQPSKPYAKLQAMKTGLIFRWFLNALGLLLVSWIFDGIHVDGFGWALIAALFLGILNAVIRPLLIILTLPITFLTMGLFILVVNALMLWLTGALLAGFQVQGFWTAMGGAIILSLISMAANSFVADKGRIEIIELRRGPSGRWE